MVASCEVFSSRYSGLCLLVASSVVPGIYSRVLFASISGVFWILASIYSYSQNIGYIASTNAEYFSSTSVKLSLNQRPQQYVAQYNCMHLKEIWTATEWQCNAHQGPDAQHQGPDAQLSYVLYDIVKYAAQQGQPYIFVQLLGCTKCCMFLTNMAEHIFVYTLY